MKRIYKIKTIYKNNGDQIETIQTYPSYTKCINAWRELDKMVNTSFYNISFIECWFIDYKGINLYYKKLERSDDNAKIPKKRLD